MGEKVVLKPESLLNLDELLQCPVCYEIPTAQIFQCNEGHHVCGRCKLRLDVCPVCRALFFGTRNYAMEELIANFRNLRSIKLGGKDSAGSASAASGSSDSSTTTQEVISVEPENDTADDDNNGSNTTDEPLRAPPACKGLFRCLCCKSGQSERLPTARLLNHLRYFHAPDLIEGRAENGEYLQAWQFSTSAGRLVTAVRVAEMGVFFLVIEISSHSIYAWLTMASSPWVAQSYNYTITLSGPDREAIFTDSVWSVRSCEGTLKRRGHCLLVTDLDAEALLSAATLGGKLSVRHTPLDHLVNQASPRAIMRVAHRGLDPTQHDREANAVNRIHAQIEPFLHDLQNDVARITRAFASLDREATAIFGNADIERFVTRPEDADTESPSPEPEQEPQVPPPTSAPVPSAETAAPPQPMSRNARRRMRQRLRAALNETLEVTQHLENQINLRLPDAPQQQVQQVDSQSVNGHSASSSSNGQRNGTRNTNARSARKKRRHRR